MFNRIVIENILGINNRIEIDFMATPKKKEKKESIIEVEPNVSINKVAGIIGANASGKSSIIHALSELRFFLAQYKFLEKAKEKNNEELVKFISNKLLPERNFENLNKNSMILLEMYIPKGEIPGYYTYSLEYNDNELNEKLSYKKKYKAKKEIVIEDYWTDVQRSDIGYKCFYKDSILKDYEKVGKQLVNKFNETMKYYNTFYQYYIKDYTYQMGIDNREWSNEDIIDFINLKKDVVLKLFEIVDSKIIDIVIEKDEDGDDIIKFKTKKNAKLNSWDLSTGTRRMLNLLISIVNTLENDGIMVCDEIETALHKELVQLIIQLYLKNDRYSQLIFTTHVPEILDQSDMRNDQKFYLSNFNEKVVINKVSKINSRSDYSISKNYYIDERYKPQPNKIEIEKFCNYIINNK